MTSLQLAAVNEISMWAPTAPRPTTGPMVVGVFPAALLGP